MPIRKILDQNGEPFDISDLAEPQTARIALLRNIYIESHLEGLTPAEASRILREADNGDLLAQHQLFDDMLDRDAHLQCEFGKRAGAIQGLDWTIEPPRNATAAEKKAAAWAEEMLTSVVDDFEDLLAAMMEAVGHGFAPVEIEWRRIGDEWTPVFHPRPQTWFALSQDRRELRLRDGTAEGQPITPMGWIMHAPGKAKTGYLGRMGLCRCLIWPFIYKVYAIGDLSEFLETYGLPIIIGKYYANAPDAEKASLFRAVTMLGHDARAIMPQEMSIEIAKTTAAGDGDVHLAMVEWAERSQSKAILGQTLSADAQPTGLGSGVANLHAQVRHDILKSDAAQIAATLTRDLIYPLLALNGIAIDALRRCPRFSFDLGESEDLKTFAETLPVLAQNGMQIPLEWAHDKLRIPMAKTGEPVFGPADGGRPADGNQDVAGSSPSLFSGATSRGNPAAAPEPAPAAALKAAPAPASDPDALDQLIAAESSEWQPLLDPMLAPLEAALADARKNNETAEAFLARLPALLEKMDAKRFAETLVKMAFTAHLAGRAGFEL